MKSPVPASRVPMARPVVERLDGGADRPTAKGPSAVGHAGDAQRRRWRGPQAPVRTLPVEQAVDTSARTAVPHQRDVVLDAWPSPGSSRRRPMPRSSRDGNGPPRPKEQGRTRKFLAHTRDRGWGVFSPAAWGLLRYRKQASAATNHKAEAHPSTTVGGHARAATAGSPHRSGKKKAERRKSWSRPSSWQCRSPREASNGRGRGRRSWGSVRAAETGFEDAMTRAKS